MKLDEDPERSNRSTVNYASILLASVIFMLVYGKFQRAVKCSKMATLAEKVA